MKKILSRTTNKPVYQLAIEHGLTELQATIIANRCNENAWSEQLLNTGLQNICPPNQLLNCEYAAKRISEAIKNNSKIGILTDYDVDGITSHAILFYALIDFFKVDPNNVSAFIGHRINQGYGISQGLTDDILSLNDKPDIIITADCGSSDQRQIEQLAQAGIDVIVTDHHAIPATGVPSSAYTTINPNQNQCQYPDKTIAGCMVSWLLMSQLRQTLIEQQQLSKESPKLSGLLDFVCLGTVADAVSLSSLTNRAVVLAGLKVMNRLERFAWQAMAKLLKKEEFDQQSFNVEDLGFQIGPRINARSRMSDPFHAFYYLTAASLKESKKYLSSLDSDNKTRRSTEKEMLKLAHKMVALHLQKFKQTIVVFSEEFHAGVQGIVASRLVDKYGLPSIVFSPINLDSTENILTASARTVDSIHIQAILQKISDLHPGILISFGGHKGAAGLKIAKSNLEHFKTLFEQMVIDTLKLEQITLIPTVLVDTQLNEHQFAYATINELNYLKPYGREFEQACFCNDFIIQSYRQVGQKGEHLSLMLIYGETLIRSIWFNAIEEGSFCPFVDGNTIRVVYQLMPDNFRGEENIQLNIQYAELI